MIDLESVAVITGAGGTLGRAAAVSLSSAHTLVLLDVNEDAALATLAELPESSREHRAWSGDLASELPVREAFALAESIGPVKALVNAAGNTTGGSLHNLGFDEWNATMGSCLTTVFLCTQAAVRSMMRSGGGVICTLGSPHADRAVPGYPAYSAAKAGVAALTRHVAAEYGQFGIRSNIVTPGWTRAPHTESRLSPTDRQGLLDSTPVGRLNDPHDVAAAIAFLCSSEASQITGAELRVDGGADALTPSSLLRPQQRIKLGLLP
ncbi:SDR family NAD(P)-dependent oxidoreductase [Paenarthrobacter sp. A20]|uniref:SDR family NAD(P)-dependent oxidoreductase n=1 Tax=Paenarthrobacter sp. A20 TaxID=2817891 RepID=UPI0020A14645|nr:SDR family oxidoreductase [Paenarthrobacter sp. A20]MCP1415734.1 NAD(P)-dependent dehydrogenase (short-subunit alcohol dehydrogenase family) [Paenarthrobacter sp. A20]